MPIISRTEARTTRGRLLHGAMFAALTAGALTMIYPFAVMLSGSLRSEMDEADFDVVPSFLVSHDTLYRKFLEYKYNEDVYALNRAHARHAFSFQQAQPPRRATDRTLVDFDRFLRENPPPRHWRTPGGIFSNKGLPARLRAVQQRVAERHGHSLERFSEAIGSPVSQWNMIRVPPPHWLSRLYEYSDNALHDVLFTVADEAPAAEQQLVNLTGYFMEAVIAAKYGQTSTAAYNAAHARPLRSFEEFALPRSVPPPEDAVLREEWVRFVRDDLNPSFVVLVEVPDSTYRTFLRGRYGTVDDLNRAWGTRHASFDGVALPSGQWLRGQARQDYLAFLRGQPPEAYQLVGPEFAWRDWLKRTYATVERLNEPTGAAHDSFDAVPMPVAAQEHQYVLANAGGLRWEFATGNYRYVLGELVVHGHALRNTMTLCVLAVLAAVIVNPLAAYGMSRFRLRGTYNVLLILMATVAFPPMVTLIPKFILLRDLGMLNTFGALVLPFAANGYLIFLLKTFFDSLPRELYEAAEIDGASEARIFWQITMSLSKPILAVVALEAFNAAYTMFLYALIVCPAEDMWLQTVWLSQFQARASTGAVYAAVVILCIPTLLVFVLAQRVIMHGILVPTEK